MSEILTARNSLMMPTGAYGIRAERFDYDTVCDWIEDMEPQDVVEVFTIGKERMEAILRAFQISRNRNQR